MKLEQMQGVIQRLSQPVAAAATAVTAETIVGIAAYRSSVVGAYFVPSAAMSGAATANRKLNIVNTGQAGAGTAIPATITFTAAVDGVANDASALTVSGTAATVAVAAGDVITVQALVNSTGLPLPAGLIVVELQAR